MTSVGFWRDEATTALRAAGAEMHVGQLVPPNDIYAVAVFRSTAYAQLARVTALLIGGPPVREVPDRKLATRLMRQPGKDANRLFAGLRGAAHLGPEYPLPSAELSAAAGRMQRAADAIGVIGDILASHVTPTGRPRTLEGRQICARGGVTSALAGVAQLTVEAIGVDRQLPGWLDCDGRRSEMEFHPLARSANWAVNGPLRAVAGAVIAAGADRPSLLDVLELSRQPFEHPPPVTTVDAAITAINAARSWLWQHPEQLTLAHLQLAANLGLAVHELVDEPGTPTRTRWRATLLTVAELRGAPSVAAAASAARELTEVLHWLRTSGAGPDGEQRPDLRRLAGALPALASTLHRGLDRATQVKNLFLRDAVLHRRQGSLIYHASQRWRPATRADDLVRDLSRALWHLANPDTTRAPSMPASPALRDLTPPADRGPQPGPLDPTPADTVGPEPARLSHINFAADPGVSPEVAASPTRAEAEAEPEVRRRHGGRYR
jgi:hypothetical protein